MRCRSSRSPSSRSDGWSTSSTTCCSAPARSTSGSSGWCSRATGSTRFSSRSLRPSAAPPWSSSPGGAELARHPRRGGPAASVIEPLAAEVARRDGSGKVAFFAPSAPELSERALAVPVSGRRDASSIAWLVVVSEDGPLGPFERLIARQAAMVVGLELMRERVVRETERRLAGDLLSEALSGRLDAEEALRPATAVRDRRGGRRAGLRAGRSSCCRGRSRERAGRERFLRAGRDHVGRRQAPAVRGGRRRRRRPGRARHGRFEPGSWPTTGRLGPPSPARSASARCVARSTRRAARSRRRRWPTARRPTSPRTTTSARSPCCWRSRTTTRFAPTATGCSSRSSGPRASTAASCCARSRPSSRSNGHWERAARRLYCHRHTLRYRIRKVEELTGRDLGRAPTGSSSGWRCGRGSWSR